VIDPTQEMLRIAREALDRAQQMYTIGNVDIFEAEVDLCFDTCNSILEDIESQKPATEAQPMG